MKKLILSFLVLVFMISVIDDASAQRRKRKSRKERSEKRDQRDENTISFKDRLNPEIKIGNISFFNSDFSAYLKSNVGYKFNKTFSAGLGAKLLYDYSGFVDQGFASYGPFAYGRAFLGQSFYVQGEYSLISFAPVSLTPRRDISFPSVGIGYVQRGFNWSSAIELLFPINEEVREQTQTGFIEYWITFSYNI